MGQNEEELTGFSWRGGIERETTGILMWSKPYIVPLPNSREEVQHHNDLYFGRSVLTNKCR